jgi:hypothetical protein
MNRQPNKPAARIDTNVTLQVNGIRTLVAGVIWGMLFAGGWLTLELLNVLLNQQQIDWLKLLIELPAIAVSGFWMPFTFLILTLILDFLMTPFNKIPILKFLLGLLLPNAEIATALVMIVADPLVHILWRINPSLIPVKVYRWVWFCSYVRVEASAANE